MYRVIIEGRGTSKGYFRWNVEGTSLSGFSRAPLLAACRQIKRLAGDTGRLAGLFWGTSTTPSLTCAVGVGAELMVREEPTVRLVKWVPHPRAGQPAEGTIH